MQTRRFAPMRKWDFAPESGGTFIPESVGTLPGIRKYDHFPNPERLKKKGIYAFPCPGNSVYHFQCDNEDHP